MVRPAPLRAVGDNEKPAAKPEPKTVAQAAKSGTQRELLAAMRDRIADAVTDAKCPPRELAALTKRLQDITRDIAALDVIDAEQCKSSGPVDNNYDASAI